jgi:hypothetical protein
MIIDLKDGNLLEILYKLNQNEVYSMIIQILYAAYLMTKNKFYHLDIYLENIMYKYTKTKYIKIFNYDIPTFGYIWSIIDYGTVLNVNYKLSSDEYNKLLFFNLKSLHNITFLTRALLHTSKSYEFLVKILLGINIKKYLNYHEIFHERRLSYDDIKYFILNADNTRKLIKYFYKKII